MALFLLITLPTMKLKLRSAWTALTIDKCPKVLYTHSASGDAGNAVDCQKHMSEVNTARDRSRFTSRSTFGSCRRTDKMSEDTYKDLTENCTHFRTIRGYSSHVVTEEELRFPVAFSILLHENGEQAERLLRAIWRPQNFYCIHVDAKADHMTRQIMVDVASCFTNVFLASKSVSVRWAEISLLKAELICMKDAWRQGHWFYYINLTGREFPLRTNWELVQILKVYNGANDIDGTPHR